MKYNRIFISDCHLGLPESHAGDIATFLESTEFNSLYIVGDFIDFWSMGLHTFWPSQNNRLVNTIFTLAQTKQVNYIYGNHDGALKIFAGMQFNEVSIFAETEFKTVDGKRILVIHGDKFDDVIVTHTWLSILGSWGNVFLFLLDPIATWIRRYFGFYKHWSLAGAIKRSMRNKEYIYSFKKLLTDYAKNSGYDGVICGHCHVPEISTIDGILYYNDGNTITELTALVENIDGSFEIIKMDAH